MVPGTLVKSPVGSQGKSRLQSVADRVEHVVDERGWPFFSVGHRYLELDPS